MAHKDQLAMHLKEASIREQSYLEKEPTAATSKKLMRVLEESGLSVHEAKGCLEFTAFDLEFVSHVRHN